MLPMLSLLFDIVVQPIIYVIQLAFTLLVVATDSPGASIVGVSVVVNLLCLPLYRMADDAQARERDKQASMRRWVDHINASFAGDERYMVLSTYYDQQGYRPAQALMGSLPLLLQVPFFMAAYTYLSGLSLLKGASFLFLPDLGSPDALLSLGGVAVNVMPVAMTLLNVASTVVYTRGLPARDKVQAYGLAALFLVLLYDSPSGLVFYWTCNQLFSLGKNVVLKVLPRRERPPREVPFPGRDVRPAFFAGAALLAVLLGVLVPAQVFGSSPTEFVSVYQYVDPLSYVVHTACAWGGLTVLWLGIYFLLADEVRRQHMALVVWCLCGSALLDYFVFVPNFGSLSVLLTYDEGIAYRLRELAVNVAAVMALCVVLVQVWKHAERMVVPALVIATCGLAALAVPSLVTTRTEVDELMASSQPKIERLLDEQGKPRPLFSLSRTGKNVMVLFMDRALSGMLPYIFDERPELEAQFDGFTYYPNTVSFGAFTNTGSPAIYGGYEYTPEAINARADESLESKHDEALLVLPTLFDEAGYATTVINPPYAGYTWTPDLSIYDQLPDVEAYDVTGAYTALIGKQYGLSDSDMGISMSGGRLFYYSLLRVVPCFLRNAVYDDGTYHERTDANPPWESTTREWAALHVLPDVTTIVNEGDTFLELANCTTHQQSLLQLPDYEPAHVVTAKADPNAVLEHDGQTMVIDNEVRLKHYHVNAAMLLQLGRWFDWMREQGVYDNTRIIIVSDHGRKLGMFADQLVDDDLDVMAVNPLFMVKDFDEHGFRTSDEFMTNADTPTLALADVLPDAVNPFTGETITSEQKYADEQMVTLSENFRTSENNGNVFDTSDAPWYAVRDDIFDPNMWRRVDR